MNKMTEEQRRDLVRERIGIENLPTDKKIRERNTTAQAANPTKGFANLRNRDE